MKTVTRQTMTAVVTMAVLVFGLLAAGCATKRDVADLKEQLVRIEQQGRQSSQTVSKMDSLIARAAGSNDALRTEMRATVRDLQTQVSALLENYQELVQVINGMQADLRSRSVLRGSVGDETHTTGGAPAQDTSPVEPPAASPSQMCDSTYDEVFLLTLQEDYENAIEGFRNFLADCSTHRNVPDAYFWIGECYFRLQRFDRALSEFEHVVATYTESPKLVPALYKVGRCNQELDRKERAKEAYDRIVNDFPDTPEATQARDRLKDL